MGGVSCHSEPRSTPSGTLEGGLGVKEGLEAERGVEGG